MRVTLPMALSGHDTTFPVGDLLEAQARLRDLGTSAPARAALDRLGLRVPDIGPGATARGLDVAP